MLLDGLGSGHVVKETPCRGDSVIITIPATFDEVGLDLFNSGGTEINIYTTGANLRPFLPHDYTHDTTFGILVPGLVALTHFDLESYYLVSIELTHLTDLQSLRLPGNSLITLNLAGLANLQRINVSANPSLETLNIANCSSLFYLDAHNCALTEEAVDAILAHLASTGLTHGFVDLTGGTNAAPSSSAVGDVTTLLGRNWTVSYNS
jgi:hypothetical protein